MSHPYDTGWREPLFVWWAWLCAKAGLGSPLGLRVATALLFAPTLALLFFWARRFIGDRGAWLAAAAYAFLPSQVEFDCTGMRNVWESLWVALMLWSFPAGSAPPSRGRSAAFAAAAAASILTRLSFLQSHALIAAAWAARARSLKPLVLLAPAALALAPHLLNAKAELGDPLAGINYAATWYANKEFIGRPGFPPTYEEWQKDAYQGNTTFRQWAFELHTRGEYVKETAVGMVRVLRTFFEKVYFAHRLPAWAKWTLFWLYVAGFLLAWFSPPLRFLALTFVFLLLPFAFLSHVFMVGRFYVAFSPLALLFAVFALQRIERAGFQLYRLAARPETPLRLRLSPETLPALPPSSPSPRLSPRFLPRQKKR